MSHADDRGDLGARRLQRRRVGAAADEAGLLGVEEAQPHGVVRARGRGGQMAADRQHRRHAGGVVVGAAGGPAGGVEARVARRRRVEVAADDDEALRLAGDVGDRRCAAGAPAEHELVRDRRQAELAQVVEQRAHGARVVGVRGVARAHGRPVAQRRRARVAIDVGGEGLRGDRRRLGLAGRGGAVRRRRRGRRRPGARHTRGAQQLRRRRQQAKVPVRAVRGDLVRARPRVEREQRPAAVGPQRLVAGEGGVGRHALVELDEQRVLHFVAQGQAAGPRCRRRPRPRSPRPTEERTPTRHLRRARPSTGRPRGRRPGRRGRRTGARTAGRDRAGRPARAPDARPGPSRACAASSRRTRSAATKTCGPAPAGGSRSSSSAMSPMNGKISCSARTASSSSAVSSDQSRGHVQPVGLREHALQAGQRAADGHPRRPARAPDDRERRRWSRAWSCAGATPSEAGCTPCDG